MYWVYAHFTADTDSVFYIGKGVTGRCSSKRSRSNFWKNIATKHGWYFVILFRGTEDQCIAEEKRLIKKIGRRDLDLGPLVNLTDGGDGLKNPSAFTRSLMSAAKLGKPMSYAGKEARRGKHASADTRLKMRQSHLGKIRSKEHCENLRIKRSDETKKRISESHLGSKNHSARSIILTNMSGIEEKFDCAKDAINKYGLHQSEVSKCCRGIRTSHRGFKIRFSE
jgi:hypothetical protein